MFMVNTLSKVELCVLGPDDLLPGRGPLVPESAAGTISKSVANRAPRILSSIHVRLTGTARINCGDASTSLTISVVAPIARSYLTVR
jgi:hypothetical protein